LISSIIITSAERRPLLDVLLSLLLCSPRLSVLRCPDPSGSRYLHQIVGPLCGGPTNAASPGTRSPFEDLSAPRPVLLTMCTAYCHLRSAIRRAMSVTLVILRISSFLISSRQRCINGTNPTSLTHTLCLLCSLCSKN
jgi:hypothetical protein